MSSFKHQENQQLELRSRFICPPREEEKGRIPRFHERVNLRCKFHRHSVPATSTPSPTVLLPNRNMKWSTLLPVAISVSLIPAALAWEVSWTDANGKKQQESGHGPSDCIQIDNPAGNLFKIDAQNENDINMLLFTNDQCSGEAAGMATQVFSKESSQHLLGFQVVSLSSTTGSTGATKTASNSTAESTGKTTATLNSASATTFPSSQSQSPTVGADESMTLLPIMSTTTTPAITTTSTTSEATSSAGSSTGVSASSTPTNNASPKLGSGVGIVGAVGGFLGLMMV
ncbi:uncharacterized protein ACLA_067110 [Aspergillus clavatus NRRL 1]|uniref:Uncharacterized protein n=1 Tax=Aspergillus clavatus (strain ATCC 1007 / CBS 513.65 / DSM 816 / NCTC 3887 / NRRL 1 / QM 1276 / 107) TaxID=344612 RepID=A1CGJ5_ASPCL|nr:uncharacterized protein ACLA_067110 [Aspergillus clavatus NRRL 1]EAW11075.1 conserved hypothetical protein [Aspergillus clavatus NRRL 1]